MNTFIKTLVLIASLTLLGGCSNTFHGLSADTNAMAEDISGFFSNEESTEDQQKAIARLMTSTGIATVHNHAQEAKASGKTSWKSYKVVYGACEVKGDNKLTLTYMETMQKENPALYSKCKSAVDAYLTGGNDKRLKEGGSQRQVVVDYVWASTQTLK